MIICESTQYVQELAAEVGVSCVQFDLITALDHLVTMQHVYSFLIAQWACYSVLLTFAWSKHAINKAKI